MINNLEAIMPAAKKDFSKIPYAAKMILNNTEVSKVHVILESMDGAQPIDGVVYHHELDVLPYGSDFFGFRPKWMFQQMLKLLQDVTEGEWYVSVDADTLVLRWLDLRSKEKPYLFHEVDSRNILKPYSTFNERMLGKSNYPFSALNNIALFNKQIIRDIINHVGAENVMEFSKIVRSISEPGCFPAEAQFYLSWILDNKPELYEFKNIRIGWRGMYDGYVFSDEQIAKTIALCPPNLDLMLLHSWETKPEGYVGGEYKV